MPSHTTHNTPALRFPGYTGVWEQHKISDIATVIGGGTPATTHNEYWNGTIDWYAPAELTNQRYVSHSQRQITQLGLENSSAQLLPAHKTVLFTSRAGIGKMAILQHEATTNQGFQSLVLHDDIDPYFIYSMNTTLKREAEKIAAGSTFLEISGSHLANIHITIPGLAEQQKIGSFFSKLDDVIGLHQRQTQKLTKLKQGLLHEMFPREGESVPRLRFPGFTTTWKQQKFSDFTWNAGKRNKDNLDLEAFAITNDRGFIRQNEAHDDFGYMKNTDRRAYNIVEPYSFAYNPARINVGSIGYYEGTKDVVVSSLYEVFKTADYIDDRFLWHWFKSDKFPQWITKLQEGSVRLYFYYDKLCECQMLMPSLDEQKKIATFFDKLDDCIHLHEQYTVKLTHLKKGLLQKMFPQD